MVTSIRDAAPPRSQLVTALAWVCIVGSALATFSSAVYTVAISLAPGDVFREAAASAPSTPVPARVRWVMDHLQLFLVLSTMGSAVLLITAVGLLRRLEWARTAFLWILGAGVVSLLSASFGRPGTGVVARGACVALALVYGLLVLKLHAPSVREEFDD